MEEPDERIKILSEVREDAKATLERQIRLMESLNTKSIEIVKFTPIVAGIFLAGLSFAAETIIPQNIQEAGVVALANELNIFIFLGFFLLFISPVFAFAAYSPQSVNIGLSNENIRDVISYTRNMDSPRNQDKFTHEEVFRYNIGQTKSYGGSIRDNEATMYRKSALFLISVLFLVFGTGALILGYLILFGLGILDFIASISLLAIIVLAIFAWTGAPVFQGLVQMVFRRIYK